MWGVLHIPERFSQALLARMLRGEEVDNKTIEDSTIKVYPDLTSEYKFYFHSEFQIGNFYDHLSFSLLIQDR